MDKPTDEGNRWRARPVVAGAVVAAVFAVPVVLSIGLAALLGHLWASASTPGGAALRWSVILGASTIVFFAGERLTRRALPLTVLLKMGMVFPGRAPRRLSVALRSWTTRDLSRRIDEARDHGVTDEPTAAAEQIVALAATLSAHDRKTRGHAERVRAYTDLIAEELRLPDDDRDRLRWSALLHDVGKLTVHSDILNKPDALSDDEWELMRQHPLEGAKLTAPLAAWLGPWSNTIAEHHERFDGRGYPFGLAGQDISMGGRIVAVADSYDTMTSTRSYKKPMSAEAARAELASCAGAQFDPVMVRAFLAVSISRLHAVAPLTWIGSLPFGNLGPQLARMVTAGGRIAITGATTTAAVVGLVAGQGAVASTNAARLSAAQRGAAGPSAPGTTASASTGGGRPGTGAGSAAGGVKSGGGSGARHGGKSSSSGHPGTGTSASGADTGAQSSGTGGTGGGSSGGDQPDGTGGGGTTGGGTGSTTTTVTSGSVPAGTTTTVGGTAPSGTTTTTSTTTTTTVPPPLVAPSAVTATAGCQSVVIGPEVKLTWTASPTTRVTEYEILRGTTKTSVTTVIKTLSGRTTVSYTDTSVSGLGSTYWYEIEAVAGSSTATSSPAVSATTGLCLSL